MLFYTIKYIYNNIYIIKYTIIYIYIYTSNVEAGIAVLINNK